MNDKLPINISLPEGFLDEEIRCDYTVTSEMKKVWAVELDLLNELLRICDKYNIEIFADGGTILGAKRHQGFIPWDDDVDMMMMRDQYEKLCSIAPSEFRYPYFFQTEYTDPGSLRGHAQLRNSETTGIRSVELKYHYKFNQGIFIDIFPIDAASDNDQELQDIQRNTTLLIRKARKNARLTSRYVSAQNILKRPLKKIMHIILSGMIGNYIGFNSYYDKYEVECKKYNSFNTDRVAKYFHTGDIKKKQVWKREWFSSSVLLKFEFMNIPVPIGYIELMNVFFGDWKTPIYSGNAHGDVIFDTNKSYINFFKDLEEMK